MAGIGAWLVLACLGPGARDDAATLREEAGAGTTRVLVELKADGEFLPGPATKGKSAPFKVEARLDYHERVLKRDDDGRPRRVARRLIEAVAAVGDARGLVKVRPVVALLIADRRESGTVVLSPSGPLTRAELDLVQSPGEPLALPGLLPEKPVRVGDRWKASDEVARNLSDYDLLTSNGLEAKLESLDADSAKIKLGGEVKGSARGGEGAIRFAGSLTFDRRAKRISRVSLTRDETRKEGPVESALKARSTVLVEREAAETPAALSDEVLATLPQEIDPRREWLLLSPAGARYSLEHARDWHLKREEARQVVLARLGKGGAVAYLNLSAAPNAGAGRHQAVEGFVADVKKALGPRFEQVVGSGDMDAGPDAGYQYKLAVVGREGDRPILWYYYLLAGPDGDQLLGIFTLDPEGEKDFDAEDRAILGTLQWKPAAGAK